MRLAYPCCEIKSSSRGGEYMTPEELELTLYTGIGVKYVEAFFCNLLERFGTRIEIFVDANPNYPFQFPVLKITVRRRIEDLWRHP